ncbi:hypothetical protein AGDE_06852 [Angomonas deanei]|uniref:Uncharacterized protein n=1 Tax=Angomonas deanei TaxID=59799 RepID=A0A7G2C752_9TRYP|nr:hypothetical protein AGDE_06852 [Angomonas deanei]CAD2214871.1 hypothetical protein, conserved [Angomonas deanei]|eukprot:EPY36569.1 hypothetical protein AGDE_06852 [Angomonas deanei]
MLRRSWLRLPPKPGQNSNAQMDVLEISSAMSLLRMCYRSIDIKVKSRQARAFFKKRLISQWEEKSKETDPQKQRLYMDLAGSFLQALHTPKNPKPGQSLTFQLSRQVAYEEKLKEREEKAANPVRTRRRLPEGAKVQ